MGGDEHRDGIQDLPTMNSVIDNHLRNMLVFENENGQGLDLLRNSPSAWLKPGKDIRVRGALTTFGAVSYQIHSTDKDVNATIECPSHGGAAWLHLYLYSPEGKTIQLAKVNGSSQPVKDGIVEIRNPTGTIHVSAAFSRAH
jgi:hypothetical protein